MNTARDIQRIHISQGRCFHIDLPSQSYPLLTFAMALPCANACSHLEFLDIIAIKGRDRWTALEECCYQTQSETIYAISKEKPIHNEWTITMPVAYSQPTSTVLSVYNNEGDRSNTGVITSTTSIPPTKELCADSTSHARRGSSATTESTESSPTTTVSTVDSTLTDPLPSSSPESPNLSDLKDDQTPTIRSMENSRALTLEQSSPRSEESLASPNKRLRNSKGLSINTIGISTIGSKHPATRSGEQSAVSLPAASTIKRPSSAIPNHLNNHAQMRPFSEPSSPAFIVPPQFPLTRRSKLGLTITTPDSRGNVEVPDTPTKTIASLPLRTRASDLNAKLNTVPESPIPLSSMRENDQGRPLFSPSMAPQGGMQLPPFGRFSDPTLPTPSFGPEGGMKFPSSGSSESSPYTKSIRPPLSLPRTSFDSPNPSSVIQHTIEHNPSTPLHDLPLSQEAKSPGYPDGPICIYPPSVFLYHQPTRDEARKFDVIINVAREVLNPFLEPEEPAAPVSEPKYKDAGVQCMLLVGPGEVPETVPSSAKSETSFSSALESFDEDPQTPKASSPKASDPEYIHLPWEHNSKVYEDWLRICQLIDDRVNNGKKVLIHCQLGVSRSASLIVAYGIYKNPRLTPDEAREQAKQQSRYIDLNMHFMYELGDFKKLLAEKYPQDQAPRRPLGHNALMRTVTDSFLTLGNNSRDVMTPVLDHGEEDFAQEQFATVLPLSSDQTGPLSAPNASTSLSVIDEALTPQPGQFTNEDFFSAATRNGDTTPRAADMLTEATLPSNDTIPEETVEKRSSIIPLPAEITILKPLRATEEVKSPPPLQLALPPRPQIENIAKNTDLLPSPHLELPNTVSAGPRKTIRPMPSLPAGFSSIARGGSGHAPFTGLKLNLDALKSPNCPPGDDILSPRAQEFTATPFHRSVRSLAGDLAETSTNLGTPRDHYKDPRSPPTKGEVLVIRNIDDILG